MTDGRTDGRTPADSKDRSTHSVAVPLIYGHILSLWPTGGFAGEHVCREIPSSSFKTAEIQHASMSCVYCPIVARQLLCSIATFAVPDTFFVNLFWLAGVFLVHGSSLDMNSVIRD